MMASLENLFRALGDTRGRRSLSFEQSVERLSALLKSNRFEDVATALFCSSLWLPNIASPISHLFFAAVFASIKPGRFSSRNKLVAYRRFRKFLSKVYRILPSFATLEDYVPDQDWGQIRFPLGRRNFKIFYGGELSNQYDYLTLFKMMYEPFNGDYARLSQRSPLEEFEQLLALQDNIVGQVSTQCNPKKISPGHLEVPPRPFWEEIQQKYRSLSEAASPELKKQFCVAAGSLQATELERENFGRKAFTGELLPAVFLETEGTYWLLPPRRSAAIVIDSWGHELAKHYQAISPTPWKYRLGIGSWLHKYVKDRLRTDAFPCVSAMKDKKFHEALFPTSFIAGDKLFLVFLTPPTGSVSDLSGLLNQVAVTLAEALTLLKKKPITLGLALQKQLVQFPVNTDGLGLEPELLIVLPQSSTAMVSVGFDQELPGRLIFLDDFLGIIDELDNAREFSSFLEFLDEIKGTIAPLNSLLDKFAMFKASLGVITSGATRYDMIALDPHMGSARRYETLTNFWQTYPPVDFFGEPRSWHVERETPTRVRLTARGFFGGAIYFTVGEAHFHLNAPFEELSYEQGTIANLLSEALEDVLSRHVDLIKTHSVFHANRRFQVSFFPLSVVNSNATFAHLKHLVPGKNLWVCDTGIIPDGVRLVRLVFDDTKVADSLIQATDASHEIALAITILEKLNEVYPDGAMPSIKEGLLAASSKRPRFRMIQRPTPASFPNLVRGGEPKPGDYKRALRRLSQLASQCGVERGTYSVQEAQQKVDLLKRQLIDEINREVGQYNYEKIITLAISKTDALIHDHEMANMQAETASSQDVDYNIGDQYTGKYAKYLSNYAYFRYLIEKVVQLRPSGTRSPSEDDFRYLAALIDRLLLLYQASDALHYDVYPVGVHINEEFVVEIKFANDNEVKLEQFAKERASGQLGMLGKAADRVESPTPIQSLLDKLDAAFVRDLAFLFRDMINVLQILAHWPSHIQGLELAPYYSATSDEINKVCQETIQEATGKDFRKIIGFLTLKTEEVLRVLGQQELCPDLPVWEYRKRPVKNSLRPLPRFKEGLIWGPYSARNAGVLWSGRLGSGILPIDLQSRELESVIRAEKEGIERALENKAHAIAQRFTSQLRQNLELYKIGQHPQELGDYDVLAYIRERNLILYLECKDLLQAHCLKDARRVRDSLFGREGTPGSLQRALRRQEYLQNNLRNVLRDLSWPVSAWKKVRVRTCFVLRTHHWWTMFPPVETDVTFVRVDCLEELIRKIEAS